MFQLVGLPDKVDIRGVKSGGARGGCQRSGQLQRPLTPAHGELVEPRSTSFDELTMSGEDRPPNDFAIVVLFRVVWVDRESALGDS